MWLILEGMSRQCLPFPVTPSCVGVLHVIALSENSLSDNITSIAVRGHRWWRKDVAKIVTVCAALVPSFPMSTAAAIVVLDGKLFGLALNLLDYLEY